VREGGGRGLEAQGRQGDAWAGAGRRARRAGAAQGHHRCFVVGCVVLVVVVVLGLRGLSSCFVRGAAEGGACGEGEDDDQE
jgi:hypothetical protein